MNRLQAAIRLLRPRLESLRSIQGAGMDALQIEDLLAFLDAIEATGEVPVPDRESLVFCAIEGYELALKNLKVDPARQPALHLLRGQREDALVEAGPGR